MVILTEKEARQYRDLEALLKKVGIDLDKLTLLLNSFDIIKESLNTLDKSVDDLKKRAQDLEVNKELVRPVTPKQILNELMGDEVPRINEEI
jgi:predicted  nucleic acid-binding Zn-ribbon protein